MPRRKHFKPPTILVDGSGYAVLKENQHFAVIDKYHGGRNRNMELSVLVNLHIEKRDARLKGSLKHPACRQTITKGAYCIVEHEQVIFIFSTVQEDMVPQSAKEKLKGETEDHEVAFQDDYPSSDSEDDMMDLMGPTPQQQDLPSWVTGEVDPDDDDDLFEDYI